MVMGFLGFKLESGGGGFEVYFWCREVAGG